MYAQTQNNAMNQANATRSPKNKFTMTEDKLLRDLVNQFGTNNTWDLIATFIPNRNSRQCHDRWFYYLSPDVNRGPWTEEEDERLRNLMKTIGPHWVRIAKHMQGRTDTQVKNRWNVLQRRLAADKKTQNVYKNYFSNQHNTSPLEGINLGSIITASFEKMPEQRVPATTPVVPQPLQNPIPEKPVEMAPVEEQSQPIFNFDDNMFLGDSLFDNSALDVFDIFEY